MKSYGSSEYRNRRSRKRNYTFIKARPSVHTIKLCSTAISTTRDSPAGPEGSAAGNGHTRQPTHQGILTIISGDRGRLSPSTRPICCCLPLPQRRTTTFTNNGLKWFSNSDFRASHGPRDCLFFSCVPRSSSRYRPRGRPFTRIFIARRLPPHTWIWPEGQVMI